MAKKIKAIMTLQIPAGKANPAPPIGPALAQHGINLMGFCKEYNARTSNRMGDIIPAEITIFSDSSFRFELKSPPTAFLIRKAAGVEKGASNPLTEKVGQPQPPPGAGDCRGENAGPQYLRNRRGHAAGRGNRAPDGHHHR